MSEESRAQTSKSSGGLSEFAETVGDDLGARSRWAVNAAIEAARTEGIDGIVTIKIPSRVKDYFDITFTVGTVEVVNRHWSMGA